MSCRDERQMQAEASYGLVPADLGPPLKRRPAEDAEARPIRGSRLQVAGDVPVDNWGLVGVGFMGRVFLSTRFISTLRCQASAGTRTMTMNSWEQSC